MIDDARVPEHADAGERGVEVREPQRRSPPAAGVAGTALALQRSAGNSAVARLLQRTVTVAGITYGTGKGQAPLSGLLKALGNPKGHGNLLNRWVKDPEPRGAPGGYANAAALLADLDALKTGGAAAEVLGGDREESAAAHIGGKRPTESGRDPDLRSADGKRALKVDVLKVNGKYVVEGNDLKLVGDSEFEVVGIVGGKSKDHNPSNFKRICEDLYELCFEYGARPVVFAAANTGEETLEIAVKAVGPQNVLVQSADGRWAEWKPKDKGWQEGESVIPEGGIFEIDM